MSTSMWILIIVLRAGAGDGGVGVGAIEFETQRNCEVAKAALLDEYQKKFSRKNGWAYEQVTAVCVEK